MLAFAFPGQGSQRIGMLDAFSGDRDVARLLDAAEGLSGLDLRRIASDGPDADLADTRASQPLLYLTDLAWATSLQALGIVPSVVAGHSLGEFAALAFVGVVSPEAGLELVVTRSAIMAEVAAATPGTMAAVVGMERDTIAGLLEGASGVWVANDNGPGQVVLSGTHAGIEWATGALTGAGARKVVPLNVTGPFHSPLMAPARDAFAEVLEHTHFLDARLPVVQNTHPEMTQDGEVVKARLMDQIVSPVRWTETMETFRAVGVSVVAEAGPGAVLTGLAKRFGGFAALSAEGDGIDRVKEAM
ncbi:MAG: ACP S-malonyltransferase [Coriobacteriia bacterium]